MDATNGAEYDLVLKGVSAVKHLGNLLTSYLSDEEGVNYKKGCFNSYVNKDSCTLWIVTSKVVDLLYHSYCTFMSNSFHASQLWKNCYQMYT